MGYKNATVYRITKKCKWWQNGKKACEYKSLMADLYIAQSLIEFIIANPNEDGALLDGLWDATVSAYGRCITKSKGRNEILNFDAMVKKFGHWKEDEIKILRNIHNTLKTYRNTAVGHRDLNQNINGIYIGEYQGNFIGIECISGRRARWPNKNDLMNALAMIGQFYCIYTFLFKEEIEKIEKSIKKEPFDYKKQIRKLQSHIRDWPLKNGTAVVTEVTLNDDEKIITLEYYK